MASMHITHPGKLVHECSVPGETRADDVFPAHSGGIQLSRDRFLFLFATRGWRGTDEDRSIIYQLHKDGFDGDVIQEGMVSQTREDWEPFGDGRQVVKLQGQPQAFGVPKGAIVNGTPAANENVFVLKWRNNAKIRDPESGMLKRHADELQYLHGAQGVEWVHFRLNDANDDIELITPISQLRQAGYENGEVLCSSGSHWMNHGMPQPVPFNEEHTEWLECATFDPGGEMYERSKRKIGAVKYAFNPEKKVYEWVETGPLIGIETSSLGEPSVMPYKGDWLIAARTEFEGEGEIAPGPVWCRANDLFGEAPEVVLPPHISSGPIAAYTCPDGVVRMVCNCPRLAPDHRGRDPLFCFEFDPENGFEPARHLVVIDLKKEGLPIRQESSPVADMAKILTHAGGREQMVVYRVRSVATYEGKTGVFINEEEKEVHGIYSAKLCYEDDLPGAWDFGS